MTDRTKRQKQFHGVSDTHAQENERTCPSSMVEAHFSSTTAERINQVETNENLIDVQIDVIGLSNNLGNLSENLMSTVRGQLQVVTKGQCNKTEVSQVIHKLHRT
eukprot:TRINITY_DN16192_c0_g1_i1.p1 TRINITY_DN16192_c0_g1~~TRINITY_DN16192_c0_g1_i1.p1  ORF type:complete len:105 (+),score=15.79 TRINITY_DN16192_c0_g1_i1:218-532(+)